MGCDVAGRSQGDGGDEGQTELLETHIVVVVCRNVVLQFFFCFSLMFRELFPDLPLQG